MVVRLDNKETLRTSLVEWAFETKYTLIVECLMYTRDTQLLDCLFVGHCDTGVPIFYVSHKR